MRSTSIFTGLLFVTVGMLSTAVAQPQPASFCQTTVEGSHTLDKKLYADKVHGFWLGLSIANWTGLVTEMDKIGGEGAAGQFYTRKDWQKKDQPSIWGQGIPSNLS